MTTLRRSIVALGVAGLLVLPGVGPAAAAPGGPGGAPNLEVLSEQYNLARVRVQQAERTLAVTTLRIASVRRQVTDLRALTQARAAELYRDALGAAPIAWIHSASVEEVGRRDAYTSAANRPDVALIGTLSHSLAHLESDQHAQESARDHLRAQAAAAEAARHKLMAEAAAARAAGTTGGDGAGPVGTPRSVHAAASPARATASGTATTSAPTRSTPAPSPTPAPRPPSTPSTSPPAPSSRAAVAVAYARAQLGKPYVFAAAGPDSFDCSGLTMAAWRAAGVSMPHYSGSQAAMFPKVPWSQLQPGDIVVFYTDYHHVGLYIGGGLMIQAPQTGDVVKISSAWRTTFQFGVRPR